MPSSSSCRRGTGHECPVVVVAALCGHVLSTLSLSGHAVVIVVVFVSSSLRCGGDGVLDDLNGDGIGGDERGRAWARVRTQIWVYLCLSLIRNADCQDHCLRLT